MNRLSQGHLNVLASCPRKFQQLFLDRLQSPPPPAQQERLEWGNRFHQLMQQQALGLPVAGLVAAEPPLAAALTALAQSLAAPDPDERWRAAEHARTLDLAGVLLTVVYDLLIVGGDRATILDWKTYARPRAAEELAGDWQTRLYLYVLAETADLEPEQLAMRYWFVRTAEPTQVTLPYDASLHAATHRDLTALLAQWREWLAAYQERGEPFPQVPMPNSLCQNCQFASRCQRIEPEVDWVTRAELVGEVEL